MPLWLAGLLSLGCYLAAAVVGAFALWLWRSIRDGDL